MKNITGDLQLNKFWVAQFSLILAPQYLSIALTGLELQRQLNVYGWQIPVIFIMALALYRWLLQR
jgi:hypothetical protein